MDRRPPRRPRRPPPGRAAAHRLHRLRLRRPVGIAALLAVLGPGLLAGLSDDDPAGITTYSILGAEEGFALLWVIVVSTGALVVFHELAARTGVVTGRGLVALARVRLGRRTALAVTTALVVGNLGTLCAEMAGVALGSESLGVSRYVAVPVAAVAVSALVLGSGFHRVEHVLLVLSLALASYIVAGILAGPDWAAVGRGLVHPQPPSSSGGTAIAVATVGTTLAPWGLAFMQSYAVDKRLSPAQLPGERVDVVTGALLTGVIAVFVTIACAATLYPAGIHLESGDDAARALEPLAGGAASTLFGVGILGAGLLAAAVVPLSTAYSVCELGGRPAGLDRHPREAPRFYGTYVAGMAIAAAAIMVPEVPLVPVLSATQVLNAVLLLAVLPAMVVLGRDPRVLGAHRLGRGETAVCVLVIVGIALACGVLAVSAVR
jgi:Mn2+/Fe2+ NRAMP family transporter